MANLVQSATNIQAALRALADNKVLPVVFPGTPVNGTSGTGAGRCGTGTPLFDVTNGILYMNTGTKASPVWQQFFSPIAATDGLMGFGVARATFDPSGVSGHRSAAAHTLGVTIPDKAIVCGGVVQVNTVFDSAASTATVAISIQTANDLITAAAVSGAPWSTAGLKAIVPKINTPESTGIALTAARLVTATVGVQALTVGKATINLVYMMGA